MLAGREGPPALEREKAGAAARSNGTYNPEPLVKLAKFDAMINLQAK